MANVDALAALSSEEMRRLLEEQKRKKQAQRAMLTASEFSSVSQPTAYRGPRVDYNTSAAGEFEGMSDPDYNARVQQAKASGINPDISSFTPRAASIPKRAHVKDSLADNPALQGKQWKGTGNLVPRSYSADWANPFMPERDYGEFGESDAAPASGDTGYGKFDRAWPNASIYAPKTLAKPTPGKAPFVSNNPHTDSGDSWDIAAAKQGPATLGSAIAGGAGTGRSRLKDAWQAGYVKDVFEVSHIGNVVALVQEHGIGALRGLERDQLLRIQQEGEAEGLGTIQIQAKQNEYIVKQNAYITLAKALADKGIGSEQWMSEEDIRQNDIKQEFLHRDVARQELRKRLEARGGTDIDSIMDWFDVTTAITELVPSVLVATVARSPTLATATFSGNLGLGEVGRVKAGVGRHEPIIPEYTQRGVQEARGEFLGAAPEEFQKEMLEPDTRQRPLGEGEAVDIALETVVSEMVGEIGTFQLLARGGISVPAFLNKLAPHVGNGFAKLGAKIGLSVGAGGIAEGTGESITALAQFYTALNSEEREQFQSLLSQNKIDDAVNLIIKANGGLGATRQSLVDSARIGAKAGVVMLGAAITPPALIRAYKSQSEALQAARSAYLKQAAGLVITKEEQAAIDEIASAVQAQAEEFLGVEAPNVEIRNVIEIDSEGQFINGFFDRNTKKIVINLGSTLESGVGPLDNKVLQALRPGATLGKVKSDSSTTLWHEGLHVGIAKRARQVGEANFITNIFNNNRSEILAWLNEPGNAYKSLYPDVTTDRKQLGDATEEWLNALTENDWKTKNKIANRIRNLAGKVLGGSFAKRTDLKNLMAEIRAESATSEISRPAETAPSTSKVVPIRPPGGEALPAESTVIPMDRAASKVPPSGPITSGAVVDETVVPIAKGADLREATAASLSSVNDDIRYGVARLDSIRKDWDGNPELKSEWGSFEEYEDAEWTGNYEMWIDDVNSARDAAVAEEGESTVTPIDSARTEEKAPVPIELVGKSATERQEKKVKDEVAGEADLLVASIDNIFSTYDSDATVTDAIADGTIRKIIEMEAQNSPFTVEELWGGVNSRVETGAKLDVVFSKSRKVQTPEEKLTGDVNDRSAKVFRPGIENLDIAADEKQVRRDLHKRLQNLFGAPARKRGVKAGTLETYREQAKHILSGNLDAVNEFIAKLEPQITGKVEKQRKSDTRRDQRAKRLNKTDAEVMKYRPQGTTHPMESKMSYPFARSEIDTLEKAGTITTEEAEIRLQGINRIRKVFAGKAGQTVKRILSEMTYGIGNYEDIVPWSEVYTETEVAEKGERAEIGAAQARIERYDPTSLTTKEKIKLLKDVETNEEKSLLDEAEANPPYPDVDKFDSNQDPIFNALQQTMLALKTRRERLAFLRAPTDFKSPAEQAEFKAWQKDKKGFKQAEYKAAQKAETDTQIAEAEKAGKVTRLPSEAGEFTAADARRMWKERSGITNYDPTWFDTLKDDNIDEETVTIAGQEYTANGEVVDLDSMSVDEDVVFSKGKRSGRTTLADNLINSILNGNITPLQLKNKLAKEGSKLDKEEQKILQAIVDQYRGGRIDVGSERGTATTSTLKGSIQPADGKWIGSKAIMDSVVVILDSKIDQKEKNTKLRAILKRDRMADGSGYTLLLAEHVDAIKQGIKSDPRMPKATMDFLLTHPVFKQDLDDGTGKVYFTDSNLPRVTALANQWPLLNQVLQDESRLIGKDLNAGNPVIREVARIMSDEAVPGSREFSNAVVNFKNDLNAVHSVNGITHMWEHIDQLVTTKDLGFAGSAYSFPNSVDVRGNVIPILKEVHDLKTEFEKANPNTKAPYAALALTNTAVAAYRDTIKKELRDGETLEHALITAAKNFKGITKDIDTTNVTTANESTSQVVSDTLKDDKVFSKKRKGDKKGYTEHFNDSFWYKITSYLYGKPVQAIRDVNKNTRFGTTKGTITAADEIADLVQRHMSSTQRAEGLETGNDLVQDVSLRTGQFYSALSKIFAAATNRKGVIEPAENAEIVAFLAGKEVDFSNPEVAAAAKELKSLIGDVYAYAQEETKGLKKPLDLRGAGDTMIPRVWNIEWLATREGKAKFLREISDHFSPPGSTTPIFAEADITVDDLYDVVINSGGFVQGEWTNLKADQTRSEKDVQKDLKVQGYLDALGTENLIEGGLVLDDLQAIVPRFVQKAVERVEYAKRFGTNDEILRDMIKKGLEQIRAHNREALKLKDGEPMPYIDEKRFEQSVWDMSRILRNKYGYDMANMPTRIWLQRATNLATVAKLPLVALASMPEFFTPLLKGDVSPHHWVVDLMAGMAWAGYKGMNGMSKLLLNRHLPAMRKYSADINGLGIISDVQLLRELGIADIQAMGDLVSTRYANPNFARGGLRAGAKGTLAGKIPKGIRATFNMQTFMQATMLTTMTEMQQLMALRNFQRHVSTRLKFISANKGKTLTGRQANKLKQYKQDLLDYGITGDIDIDTSHGEAEFNAGALRFIDQVITRPNDATTAKAFKNPLVAPLVLFKRFITTFGNTLLTSVGNDFAHKVDNVERAKQVGKVMTTAVAMYGAVMFSEIIRGAIKGDLDDDDFTFTGGDFNQFMRRLDRTGLLSAPGALAVNMAFPYKRGWWDSTESRIMSELTGPLGGDAVGLGDALLKNDAAAWHRFMSQLVPTLKNVVPKPESKKKRKKKGAAGGLY